MAKKEMRCGDIMKGCDFVATGDTEQEVMQKAAEHARSAHLVKDVTPDMAKKVQDAIRDRAA